MTRLSAVVLLLTSRCPAAIHRPVAFNALRAFTAGVIAIVIRIPIKSVSRRATSHVTHEGNEIISPSRTHRNPATSVVFTLLERWAEATSLCVFPGTIFRGRFAPAPRVAVNHFEFPSVTPAACSLAASQMIAANRLSSSADTTTVPIRSALFILPGKGLNKKAIKFLTDKIDVIATGLTATLAKAMQKIVAGDFSFAAAVAAAKPFLVALISKNGPTAKAPTGQINQFTHNSFLPQFCGEFQ